MPPVIKTDRKAILDAAIDLIETEGIDGMSARTLSARLSISTQPIYREFGDMESLRKAAMERGLEIFWEYIKGDAIEQAVRYVSFACEHKRLFEFLFRRAGNTYDGLDDLAHKLLPASDIIDRLTSVTGLPRERVYRVHLYIWMALNGIASYAADNNMRVDESEIREFTLELSRALSQYYGRKEDVRA